MLNSSNDRIEICLMSLRSILVLFVVSSVSATVVFLFGLAFSP